MVRDVFPGQIYRYIAGKFLSASLLRAGFRGCDTGYLSDDGSSYLLMDREEKNEKGLDFLRYRKIRARGLHASGSLYLQNCSLWIAA